MFGVHAGIMFFKGILFTLFRGFFFTSLSVSWNTAKILHGPPEGLPKKGTFFHLSHVSVFVAEALRLADIRQQWKWPHLMLALWHKIVMANVTDDNTVTHFDNLAIDCNNVTYCNNLANCGNDATCCDNLPSYCNNATCCETLEVIAIMWLMAMVSHVITITQLMHKSGKVLQ